MCHHRYRCVDWEAERLAAPGEPVRADRETGPVRVGDADRERVAALLRDHAAAGRLDPDELEARLERAYAARYGSDLEAVLAELPPEQGAPSARRPARGGPWSAAPSPLLPLAIGALVAVAAVTGTWWLLWLIWPIVVVLGPKRHDRRAVHWR